MEKIYTRNDIVSAIRYGENQYLMDEGKIPYVTEDDFIDSLTPIESIKFTIEDIKDKSKLDKMVNKEARSIFESEVARKGRDFETVKYCVQQGKIAELWLIENKGFEEADKRWHDLKDSVSGEYAEVKAYSIRDKHAPSVQRDLRRLRNESWNISKWYYLFKCEDGNYELLDKIKIK